jgi:hypothetical protein
VALERVFGDLPIQLRKLSDALREVRLTLCEDRPTGGNIALLDDFEYALEDCLGWLDEAATSAGDACQGVTYPLNLDRARWALTVCQKRFDQAEERFLSGLVSPDRLQDLMVLADERRGEWGGWVSSLKRGLEPCRDSLKQTSKALLACLQEIAERVGTTTVSIQNTNIGRQLGANLSGRAEVEENGGI